MDRKEFIKNCGMSCIAMMVPAMLLEGCAGSNYFARFTTVNNTIAIRKTEFVQTDNGKTTMRKYILIKADRFSFPICIYKLGEESYSALLMECTHKSCELQPHGDYLICPCHGSEFSNKGAVQNPPAEQHLQSFNITSDHENIYIAV